MKLVDEIYRFYILVFCLLHYQENKVRQRQADKPWIQDWWIMVNHGEIIRFCELVKQIDLSIMCTWTCGL